MSQDADTSRNSEQGPEQFSAPPLSVAEALSFSFVRQDGWGLNYLQSPSGKRLNRLSVIGIIVGRPDEQTFIIDDGTGSIVARMLDRAHEEYAIGDAVNIRARPGELNDERFLFAEIVKKLDSHSWLKVRKLELESRTHEPGEFVKDDSPENEVAEEPEQDVPEPILTNPKKPAEQLSEIIRELDEGSGADVDDVMKKAESQGIETPENLMQSLLERGEIFVPRPGLVKTLE